MKEPRFQTVTIMRAQGSGRGTRAGDLDIRLGQHSDQIERTDLGDRVHWRVERRIDLPEPMVEEAVYDYLLYTDEDEL